MISELSLPKRYKAQEDMYLDQPTVSIEVSFHHIDRVSTI